MPSIKQMEGEYSEGNERKRSNGEAAPDRNVGIYFYTHAPPLTAVAAVGQVGEARSPVVYMARWAERPEQLVIVIFCVLYELQVNIS